MVHIISAVSRRSPQNRSKMLSLQSVSVLYCYIHVSVHMQRIIAVVDISEAFEQSTKTKQPGSYFLLVLLIYRQQSCTHVVFSQWING